jgi:hypothetical protein
MDDFHRRPRTKETFNSISQWILSLRHSVASDPLAENKKGAELALTPDTQASKKNGGDERDRTADLLVANETLSQLSYIPPGPTPIDYS